VGVLQYKDLVIEVDGQQKGLVQNVTVSCDAGLDLITHYSGVIPYIKDTKGRVSFEQLVSGIVLIDSAPLFNSIGEIRLYDNVGSGYISASECTIDSIECSLITKGFFSCKYEYIHLGIEAALSGQSFAGYSPTGRAPHRAFYTGGAPGTNHQSITVATKLNRKTLYNKGDARPKHSVIPLPIETTVSLEMNTDSTGLMRNIQDNFTISPIQDCLIEPEYQNMFSIPELYLNNVSTDGGGVDGSPLSISAEYISYYDYGVTVGGRIINYSSYDSGGGGQPPPPEPE
jgi:hypothetical protein